MDTLPPNDAEAKQKDIKDNKDMAALSYVWILSVILFFARKDSPFIRYHSKQAMILFILSIPIWTIPMLGHYLILVIVAGNLIGFINAANGLYADVPFVGPLSRGEKSIGQVCKEGMEALKELWKKFMTMFEAKKPEQTTPGNPVQSQTPASPSTPAEPPAPSPSSPPPPSSEEPPSPQS